MEENKCCTGGQCEKCKGDMSHKCCMKTCCMKKCCIMRIIAIILVLVVVFCLGATFGSHRDGFREYGNQKFMTRGFNRNLLENDPIGVFGQTQTGSTTVQVQPSAPTAPAAQ